ncbi:MAG: methylmalonyl-CoA epimerase [Anaerolineae bacterium]|nr:methylmalonyl-CoA epimerase [Anaerolineae bacterium]
MIGRIDHIGIAVADLASALDFYDGALGLAASEIEEVPDQQVRLAVIPVGESRLELLQSTAPDGPVGRFVEKHGEGIHHICFEVDDIDSALATLRAAGVRLIDQQPRTGAGGRRIAFLHPRSAHGVLIELSESPGKAEA